ncbi:glutamate-1-semialdehyde 2,1-aminomutase [Anaerocolumna sp. AGMB13020]|uniref:glutamate-1-semialdehyde 2,1-aminomutase n=1 Tax=Anaerocolumna sp. AGMB13020 TaxID=3081750 RepID=UPI002953D48D|nr:glutamate-1-semialdehyde 2,1-aminomutase [Anaerocolumna sp. AGMB13020]WOO36452.1 glutamate-1-semialdehyde 2,1-aminomutase [Anaerocolumna sp. AGMB13020]
MKDQESQKLYEEALQYMPGGVNSPVRAFRQVNRNPLFIEKGKGSRIYDADGNEFIDYVGSYGPLILGHAREEVVEAVREAAACGLTFGAPTRREIRLTELIQECVPSMEMVRLVNSGTEAVMSALRLARGYTGRKKIIKFTGCYHGHSDGLLAKAGSGLLTQALPDSLGVPKAFTKHTLLADYNDTESVKELFHKYKGEIAAVIVEPVAANMGVVLPEENFLSFLRKITDDNGSLLVFDEVITGFRLALGGAQEYFQVKPDLTTLGKIVGGGMPIGAYGGRREIMEKIAPLGPVYQAGTLSGNPLSTAAGIKTLELLKSSQGLYEELAAKGELLRSRIQTAGKGRIKVNSIGSLLCIYFTEGEIRDYNSALTAGVKDYAIFFEYLLENGIYAAPSQFEAMFLSGAHTAEDVEYTAQTIEKYFGSI